MYSSLNVSFLGSNILQKYINGQYKGNFVIYFGYCSCPDWRRKWQPGLFFHYQTHPQLVSLPLWLSHFILTGAISNCPLLLPSSIVDTFWPQGSSSSRVRQVTAHYKRFSFPKVGLLSCDKPLPVQHYLILFVSSYGNYGSENQLLLWLLLLLSVIYRLYLWEFAGIHDTETG